MAEDVITLLPQEEIKPEAKDYQPAFVNLCEDEEGVVKQIRQLAAKKLREYESQRNPYDGETDGIWCNADYMWRCGTNDSVRTSKQSSDTLADTGWGGYFRQVRTIASQIIKVMFSKEDPARYNPLMSTGTFMDTEEAQKQSDQYTNLFRYTRIQDEFKTKAIELLYMLCKYGNFPVMMNWKNRKGMRNIKTPVRDAEGNVTGAKFEEKEFIIENRPSLEWWCIESVYADVNIGNMQDQQCVLINTHDDPGEIFSMARSGDIMNADKIEKKHLYIGDTKSDLPESRMKNEGIDDIDLTGTGLVNRWDVWIKAPIGGEGDKKEWDETKYAPEWYWCIFAGDIESGPCLLVRETPDPDKEFPGEMIHLIPDDNEKLYHLSLSQIIASNYDEAVTKKNQAIDYGTLINRRPMIGIRGEVFGRDLKYEANKILWVEKSDSLSLAPIAPALQDTITVLTYIDEDSNKTVGTDKPIMGESLGGRTSATEAQNVYDMASAPIMVLVRYVLDQLIGFYARKSKSYWDMYAAPNQILEITGSDDPMQIKPQELYGDFEIKVDLVDEYIDDAMAQKNLNYLMQILPALPNAQQDINWQEVEKVLFEKYRLTKSPAKFFTTTTNIDAERVAHAENQAITIGQVRDEPQEGENHETHLRIHKSYRQQYHGLEDQYPPGYFNIIDNHIAATEQMMQNADMQTMQQGPQEGNVGQAPSGNTTVGMETGNAMAAEMGAQQNV